MNLANQDRAKAVSTLFRLLGAAVVAGVLVAFIALPGVGGAGLTARNAAEDFESMDADLKTSPPSEKTVVYDAGGKQIATFFDRYRESVRLDQVAPIMRTAMVDIEDSRFYEHGALDIKGTIRALASNVETEQTQGGSTLTQQYVKNMLVDSAKTKEEYAEVTAPTVGRKIRELRYALHLEETMKKDEILQGYLNIAYFGAGAYGVQAASKRYFSKPASKLTLDQAALLAGITQNPTAYDPILHPQEARKRRDTVLYRMAQLGHISQAQAQKSAAKPIELNRTDPVGGCQTSDAPYFCEYVKYDMLNILSKGKYASMTSKQKQTVVDKLNRGGYVIRTTLDRKAQKAADRALRNTVSPTSHKVGAEAMVEPGTGKLMALGLSKEFGPGKGKTTINLGADAAHGGGIGISAGSTFKVFTLATALEEGLPVTTSFNSGSFTTVTGMTRCDGSPGGPFPVHNSDPAEAGSYNLKTGTWHSVNTFYAQLEKRVGLCDAVKMAKRFGMKRGDGGQLEDFPSQVLGTNEIDMVHLAAAYAGFAARGKYCTPISITEVTDANGKKLDVPKSSCNQAVDQSLADQVNSILQGVLTKGTARGRSIGRPAAGKTGTCEDHMCAVFAGFTPNLAAASAYWDPRGPMKYKVYGVFGADQPASIWQQSMEGALSGRPAPGFSRPTGDFGDTASVPDVHGMSVGEASAKLRALGFDVNVSAKQVESDLPKGKVESTSPGAGGEASIGSIVILYVSDGHKKDDDEPDDPDGPDIPPGTRHGRPPGH